jgi:hypothetical protein
LNIASISRVPSWAKVRTATYADEEEDHESAADDEEQTKDDAMIEDAMELLGSDFQGDIEDVFTHSIQSADAADIDDEPADGPADESSVAHSVRKIRGNLKNRVLRKGRSAYNDKLKEMEESIGEEELSAVMIKWYSVNHNLDDFFPGQEPLLGTYDCRFCGKDLNDPHRA